MNRTRLPWLLSLALAGACTEDPATSTDPDDTTAPTIGASSPEHGAEGVFLEEVVKVTFSEPMDAASVEAAWSSDGLSAADVRFSWSDDGTVLTVTPDDPLEPEREYTVEIGADASDRAGNALGEPFTYTFETVAVLTVEVSRVSVLCGTEFDNSTNSTKLMIGDAATGLQYMPVISFAVSDLPDGTLHVAQATLSGFQNSVSGTPYDDLGGAIVASSVTFGALGAADEAIVHGEVGAFSDSPELSERELDVTDAVRRDWEERMQQEGLSQFRFLFDVPTDDDGAFDYASFDVDGFDLEVTIYLLPPIL